MATRRPIRKFLHKKPPRKKKPAAPRARRKRDRAGGAPPATAGKGPTERLLTLIATLLDARRPIPLADLREKLPAGFYDGSDEAAERKFERDKDVLEELGVPIRFVSADPDDPFGSGYVIDREKLYLPNLELTADESAALFLGGSALLQQGEFPYRDDLERALEKIRLRGDVPAPESGAAADRVLFHYPSLEGGVEMTKKLAVIESAIEKSKTLTMAYKSGGDLDGAKRKVDPYALVCRRGRWLLVGLSHERAAVRVFTVQKIESVEANAAKPRSPDFAVPAAFDLKQHVGMPPWRYERHAPITVEIDVESSFAWLAEQELETTGVSTMERKTRFHVTTTNQDALAEWLLGMGAKARVVSPEPLRRAVRERLDAVLAIYDGAGAAKKGGST